MRLSDTLEELEDEHIEAGRDNHIEVRWDNHIEAQGRCDWNAVNSSLRYIDKELTLCFDQNP
jgi:hypothetical protein